jgi:hypothetical protein
MQINNQNKLLFYFLLLIWLFLILSFSKSSYLSVLKNLDTLELKNVEYIEKEKISNELDKISKDLWNSKNLVKYTHEVKEDELIDYFYNFVSTSRSWSGFIIIDSISFDKWAKNQYAFNEWRINLALTVSDEQELFQMLDFITHEDSSYKFFIDSFSFPNDPNKVGSLQVNIPIKMFYK